MINVTIWNEYVHEREIPEIARVYPEGIHGCIKKFLETDEDLSVRTSTLSDPEAGLSESLLEDTDVLIWWGHCRHDDVPDEAVRRIQNRVLGGMGLIALHSAHHSKIMKALLGTSLNLSWRDGDRERLWCIKPGHRISQGVPEYINLPSEEMYGEPFDIPEPDETLFLGWFKGGEVFRSGCTFKRGAGRIFYFQPGHEAYPIYYDPDIQHIIINAVHWASSGCRDNVIPITNRTIPPEWHK